MNVPGFTAEASVYSISGHYRLATRGIGGIVVPPDNQLIPQTTKDDLAAEGATCGKEKILGNWICTKCTGNNCTDHVCDKNGNDCTPTKPKPIIWQLLTVLSTEWLTAVGRM